jgi:hypothetical protein
MEIYRSDEALAVQERQQSCRSLLIVSMSFRLAIPGELLSSRARFRFTNRGRLSGKHSVACKNYFRSVAGSP